MAERSRDRFRDERARRFAAIKAGTSYRRNLLLAAVPGIALGLVLAAAVAPGVGLIVAIAGAIAGPAIYQWSLWKRGSDEAELAVMQGWAAERGWSYIEDVALPDNVAFCRNRKKPVCEDGFAGLIAGLPGMIFNFTYSTYETRTGANGATHQEEVKHHHTVLRLDLGDLGLRSLQLSPQGLGGGFTEKLRSAFTGSRSIDLESTEFNGRYTLLVEDDSDDVIVRRVFEPAFVVRCVEGRFPMATFQYERPSLSFIWDDRYDVEKLEEVGHRVADATPMAEALTAIRDRLAPQLGRP
jgi:hypothetical protein